MRWALRLLASLIFLAAGTAGAQILQSGNVTPGHVACWTTNGVLQDCGTASNNSTTTFGVTSATGTPLCVNDAVPPAPFHSLCLGLSATAASINLNAFGGAAALPLNFNVNGVTTSVAGGLVPTPGVGNILNYIRINAAGTGYEARTPALAWGDLSSSVLSTPGLAPFFWVPSIHPNIGGVSGSNYVRTDQNAAFEDIDQVSVVSHDPTTNPNAWTVSGTVTAGDVLTLSVTYTPTGGSQKTVNISVTVTTAMANASGGSPFVLNGFSATDPQYAVTLQMQQNWRTNSTLLADFGAAFIAPASFTLLNVAFDNFPSVGTSEFSFNFLYPQVQAAGTTFQATKSGGATEVVSPTVATAMATALENNPFYSLGRRIVGRTQQVGDTVGAFYVVAGDSLGGTSNPLTVQYMNMFVTTTNITTGAWGSTVTWGSGNWPLGTGSSAMSLGQGLQLGHANVFSTGGDKGAMTINVGNGSGSGGPGSEGFYVRGGVAQLGWDPGNVALLSTNTATINFRTSSGISIQLADPSATPVNFITFKSAATGNPPQLTNNGSTDANPGLLVPLKGSGPIIANANVTFPTAGPAGTIMQLSQADTVNAVSMIDSFAASSSLLLRRADGTSASKSALQNGDVIGQIQYAGFGATAYSSNRAAISIATAEIWTDTAQGTQLLLRATPPTTVTPGNVLTLNSGANAAIANAFTISAQSAGTSPQIAATGTDASIGMFIVSKISSVATTELSIGLGTGGLCAGSSCGNGQGNGTIEANAGFYVGSTNVISTARVAQNLTGVTSSGTITFSGLTTGTNADFLCLSGTNTVLIQASACTISSLRFKKDVRPWMGNALAEVMALEPITFRYRDNEDSVDRNAVRERLGLSAENVDAVNPLLAVYEPDMATPKSWHQDGMIALLAAAIQQQQHEIEAMRRQ